MPAPYSAHRPSRHARHSRQLRRIRNLRRRTFHPAGGARPPGDRLLPRAPFRSRYTAACGLHYLPTIRHKYFDTLAHTFLSTLHLLAHRVDAALYCNGANAIFTCCAAPVRHARGAQRGRHRAHAQEVEPAGQSLVPGFRMAGHLLPHRGGHRRAHHSGLLPRALRQSEPSSFPTARKWARSAGAARSATLGLEPGRYFLYVSRMEPENHPLEVRAGVRTGGDAVEAGAGGRRALRAANTSAACATPAIRAS